VKELIEALVEEYETDEKTAADDVFSFISDMKKYLIVND
jgi:hypothetical protein